MDSQHSRESFEKLCKDLIPNLSGPQLDALVTSIKDYQLTHGSIIKRIAFDEGYTVPAHPIGVTIFPIPFPRLLFETAQRLQSIWNELYVAISEDPKWLEKVLNGLLEDDSFTKALWTVYTTVRDEGFVQNISAGIFRSDYMLHTSTSIPELQLKQVEFNTWSCAGGVHANIVSNLHRHQSVKGSYIQQDGTKIIDISSLPENHNVDCIVATLEAAHQAYGSCKSQEANTTGILMVVQPNNVNVADERPIEYALWDRRPSIPVHRIHFGREILRRTKLNKDRVLLYEAYLGRPPVEISVVYHRAGIDADEYEEGSFGIEARIHLERSCAIKCPSVLCHLAGFKKVQEALTTPEVLKQFILSEKAEMILKTVVPMYPLDKSERGLRGRELARDANTAYNYVMKPSLEGGGHNIYREDIVDALESMQETTWRNYILMELIKPPTVSGLMMTPLEMYEGPVVSELGIWGGCVWRTKSSAAPTSQQSNENQGNAHMLSNETIGWSVRTKPEEIDEMSVVKGYGSFDSPYLV